MRAANVVAITTALLEAEFAEELHPRDDHGKFAPAGSLQETSKVHYTNKDYNPKFALNNKQLREVKKPDFQKYTNPDLKEPEMVLKPGQKATAGVIIVEPDHKTWIVSPKNYFGGYRNVFPKGTQDQGEQLQQTAVREVWEETGLLARITGYLGDVQRSTSVARYYIGERVTGSPAKAGPETHAVKLVDIHDRQLPERLSDVRGKPTPDQKVLKMLRDHMTEGVAASWQPRIEYFDDICASCESGDCMIHADGKPKCPHCGSTEYELMPTDFETAKCSKCGKNWDHGIVKGINDPGDLKADTDELKNKEHYDKHHQNIETKPSDVTSGGPGSGRHTMSIPALKQGQRGVGKFDGAVFPVHGPGSQMPGRHFSHGQYEQTKDNEWQAPNKKTKGTFTVQRKVNPDGSATVTRWTKYLAGDHLITQPSEHMQYPDKKSADAHMKKRFGIEALTAEEDRICAFAQDALESRMVEIWYSIHAADWDESLHPRDKGGKFASKGEAGAQPITPTKKIQQLNQMGFQYKGSHLDQNGNVTKDVFEKQGTNHEVHVTKYNTTHPGNADLRKYSVVDKNTGKLVGGGNHQISKVQDFVSKQTSQPAAPAAPKSAAPVPTPAVAPIKSDGWTLANGGNTAGTEAKALQNAGFTYQSTTNAGKEDLWTHPSGAYVKVLSSGMKVGSADGAEQYHPQTTANKDWEGKEVSAPITKAIADSQSSSAGKLQQSVTPPTAAPTGKMPADDKISSKSEQQTLAQNGFQYLKTNASGIAETWQHPSGATVNVLKDGYAVFDKNGNKVGEGNTVYHTIGNLDQPIKDAVDKAQSAPAPTVTAPTTKSVVQPTPAPPSQMNKSGSYVQNMMTKAGFVFVGKGKYDSDVWQHPDGTKLLKLKNGGYIQPPGQKSAGDKVDWNKMQQVLNSKTISTPPAATPAATGSTLIPSAQANLNKEGFTYSGKTGTVLPGFLQPNAETWANAQGTKLTIDKSTPGGATWSVHNANNELVDQKQGYVLSGGKLHEDVAHAIGKAQTPVDHPTKAVGPQIPALGKNNQLSQNGYEFQKHEGGSDYWTKPGAQYGVKVTPTDATHSSADVIDNKTGVVQSSHSNAGEMISKLDQLNNPTPASTSAKASSPAVSSYVAPPAPKTPPKEWDENTDKAWQAKARTTVTGLWKNATDDEKNFSYSGSGSVYKKIADALGVPYKRLQEVKDQIASWQGGHTANDGNPIGKWAQQIVNSEDQVHPGLFIEHLVTGERLKEKPYGGQVPALYRGLSGSGSGQGAQGQPTVANIPFIKQLLKFSPGNYHFDFPMYGAEGFSSAKTVSIGFGKSNGGITIEKPKGSIPPDWVMSSRDLNPQMWTGYAGEHEWAIACPTKYDTELKAHVPKMPIESGKGDIVHAAVAHISDADEAKFFGMLAKAKKSGWDYTINGTTITLFPPPGVNNANWFKQVRKVNVTASEDKPTRRVIISGLPPIQVEWETGQTRTGTNKDGTAWSQIMPYAYGRFTGTKGLDGEPIDVILGRNPNSAKVFIACIPQNLGNEEKVMVGFDSLQQAKIAFLACYGYQQKYLQTIGETTKPMLVTLMKVRGGKSAMLTPPREVKAAMPDCRCGHSHADHDGPPDYICQKCKNCGGYDEVEEIKADGDYFESTPGLNVIPTSHPPSLANPKEVPQEWLTDGWHKKDSKKKKKQAREDMAVIMDRTRRQTGKPELAETSSLSYLSPYPDTIL